MDTTNDAADVKIISSANSEEKRLLPQKQVQVLILFLFFKIFYKQIIDPVKAVDSLGNVQEREPAEQRITLK